MAAFNRYQTLDVVRAVCNSQKRNQIALYTGNDDNIVADLLTPYRFNVNGEPVEKRFVGGLLGHWAVWTKKATELLDAIKQCLANNCYGMENLLAKGIEVTDMNEVIFDAKNSFHGCIPGIHEVLRRQGLLEGRWCLNPKEELSNGQIEEIDRIYKQYPEFTDDEFVQMFLAEDKKLRIEIKRTLCFSRITGCLKKTIYVKQEIKQLAKEIRYVIENSRHLHAHPELSFHEYETSAYVKARLDEMEIPWKPMAGTG